MTDKELLINRDDSDAGLTEVPVVLRSWTLDEVRDKAVRMGKQFLPNTEIAERLKDDLASNRVIVLFSPEDVSDVISGGLIIGEMEEYLLNLVSDDKLNDVAVITAETVEAEKREQLIEWFLTNNRC